ncbi:MULTISPECIES: hypothetical protein [Bacillus cereus group]|uniref:hypothetical protein n=1 Tax=Bacillus cereus group TaxID=86661 RepID=UPI000BFA37B5|nr:MULTISPECIES: hypothetical protein [Bacillus cereus group]MDR5045735.1 hypothetical protein [Bacillus thuringiensis]MEB8859477.1 hypothetical protein [Bacillus cereus]MEB9421410.1 hypothetical protein [Bacillus cereus]MRC85995.1 hypothetical protein [Bacillus thuringiensis]PFK48932.1 hypothetical protein COJ14_23100 [Bacillus cereus]
MEFYRWQPRSETSWAWRVFKKHNDEFYKMYTTFYNSYNYTYKMLGINNAEWEDQPEKHFNFEHGWEKKRFTDIKDWSTSFNGLENWTNLNALVAISSNLETYIATIVPLALESDIGVLFGTPRRIDGIEIIKFGNEKPSNFDKLVVGCTKGTWESRLNTYERLFGTVPQYLRDNIGELEKIRNIRNEVAHAFGRDIDESRKNGEVTTLPIKKLSRRNFIKLQTVTWRTAKEIDNHLYREHIGDYQSLLFYHNMYLGLNHQVHPSQRAMQFKKKIGQHGDIPASKKYCKELVEYYESL